MRKFDMIKKQLLHPSMMTVLFLGGIILIIAYGFGGVFLHEIPFWVWVIGYSIAFSGLFFVYNYYHQDQLGAYAQPYPKMNTFATYSDMQVIFINESQKVLIECSESLVKRYHLKEYVHVVKESEYLHYVHPDDMAQAKITNFELEQPLHSMKEVKFRIQLPGMDEYVLMFRKGYYELDSGYGYLAFDISNTHYISEQLKEKEEKFHYLALENQKMLENTKDLIVKMDKYGTVLQASKEAIRVYGKTPTEVLGRSVFSLNESVGRFEHSWFEEVLKKKSTTSESIITVEGKTRHISWSFEAIMDDFEDIQFILAIGHEITHYIESNDRLKYEKNHDPLTGLLNQQGLLEVITQLEKVELAASFFIDLRAFSQINDYYGHTIGDEILRSIAQELKTLEDADCLVARYSGDEFVVLCLNRMRSDENIKKVLKRLNIFKLAQHETQNIKIQIKKSIGYAKYPEDTQDLKRLISLSSLAMKENAKRTSASATPYHPELSALLKQNVLIASKLRDAIDEGRIDIHFQHVLDFNANAGIIYVEGLARWYDADLGHLKPEEFIAIAQESNLIDILDRYLVEKTLGYYAALKKQQDYAETKLLMNISPEMVLSEDLIPYLIGQVRKNGLEPSDISIEISEKTFVHNFKFCLSRLVALKEAGFKISLDDFGKDFSSLAVLETVQFDIVKIDALFTENIHLDKNQEIVKMVRKVTDLSGKEIVIEGVETEAQKETLLLLGCTLQQGFLFHKPEKLI